MHLTRNGPEVFEKGMTGGGQNNKGDFFPGFL
jgi:hypothetical protein